MPPKKNANARGDKNLTQKSPAEFFQDNKGIAGFENAGKSLYTCLLYTSPSPRDRTRSRMPSSA